MDSFWDYVRKREQRRGGICDRGREKGGAPVRTGRGSEQRREAELGYRTCKRGACWVVVAPGYALLGLRQEAPLQGAQPFQNQLLQGSCRTQQQRTRRCRAEVSQGRPVGGSPLIVPLWSRPDGSTFPAWARPLSARSSQTTSPAGSESPPILAPPFRPVPLSYKLLDGEAALPALVFLHGLFGCKTNFNSIAKALAQQTGRRVSFRGGGVP